MLIDRNDIIIDPDLMAIKQEDEPIYFSRLIGRLYRKKAYMDKLVDIAGEHLYTGQMVQTPKITGRSQPQSRVPAHAAEGLQWIRAVGYKNDDVFVGNARGHVAMIRLGKAGLIHSACTCGQAYTCSNQVAALYVALARSDEFGERFDQLRELLKELLATDPADFTVEQVLLACDAGYLVLNSPDLRDEMEIRFQSPVLRQEIVDALRDRNIVEIDRIGPRNLAGMQLGHYHGIVETRPDLAPLLQTHNPYGQLVAKAQHEGVSPASMMLDL